MNEPRPGDDLRAAVRDEVDVRELLEHADRVVGRKHRDRARQADLLRDRPDRSQCGRRRADQVVGAMVFPDREHGQPELVREPRLLDQVLHPLLGGYPGIDVGEGDES